MPTRRTSNPYSIPQTKYYRKIDRAAKLKKQEKNKILDEDIDDFISNLSCDTSDMSDDSDFEFDGTVVNQICDSFKPEVMKVDTENLETIFNLILKCLPPHFQWIARHMRSAVIWSHSMAQMNAKFLTAVYFHSSLFVNWIIHFLFIISSSYKTLILMIYRLIIRIDNLMDRILDDRQVSSANPMMSDKNRELIAETMKLSKTPISSKRARELLRPQPAGSKILDLALDPSKQATDGSQFWEFVHGIGTYAKSKTDLLSVKVTKSSKQLEQATKQN